MTGITLLIGLKGFLCIVEVKYTVSPSSPNSALYLSLILSLIYIALPGHANTFSTSLRYTSSTHVIMSAVLDVYDRVVHKDLLIRRVNVTACNLVSETEIPEDKPEQLDMFTDYEALEQEKKARQLAEEKERRLQNVTLAIQDKFGKNAMLKGMNLMEGGTTIARNGQIGGHKAGDE